VVTYNSPLERQLTTQRIARLDGWVTTSTARPTVARIIVSTADLDRALAFYAELVGLELTRRSDPFAWLRTGEGVEVMLHERDTTPSRAAVAVGLVVAELDATVATWAARGGEVIDEPADQPWGERMAVVTDPDGHVVCLSQRA
jgi:predicted enzyme related to lactoylglutathione lyase